MAISGLQQVLIVEQELQARLQREQAKLRADLEAFKHRLQTRDDEQLEESLAECRQAAMTERKETESLCRQIESAGVRQAELLETTPLNMLESVVVRHLAAILPEINVDRNHGAD